ncbi:1,4-alpha-glucan branching protein GlgB [Fusibacter tunisiensis]|uniref:1,4-alpha-glucan branching enzyme GlgB n=1 Tax=Fusibacter tunisiensis TaxID=1008308 RepID=A0ABS2MSH4_9FIRM|nr:1,4-alpha-glucan branching protein GlgB [Fusibacter tunisiensis]MBM7562351.1 1,4-alpha-glucan branching enzyme [Fusibacter tunisiensis]
MTDQNIQDSILKKGYFYLNEGDFDIHLFHEGSYYKSYEFLGAHYITRLDIEAVRFVVWSPNATAIHLMGDFNDWDETQFPMQRIKGSSLWQICIPGVQMFDRYKYRITATDGQILYKADPYAFHAEERPETASKFYDLKGYIWHDSEWLKSREASDDYNRPISIYEVNLLSWRKKHDGKQYSYHDLAQELIPYVKEMNFTHIELMPIMEHPYDGSWGYQITGYYAPTSRFGTPKDFMYFVDTCHQNGIGVILDWVPGHYCKDAHGLYHFDGGSVFESHDYDKAHNDEWGTANFDYGKPEVKSFLISNLLYWHDYYHVDGIRIDAVAYMLYLNFGGKLLKNKYGGFENLEAVDFIKQMNEIVFKYYPNTLMMAEESTAWPMVSWPTASGGLGFNYKWNMGWMNDILEYMQLDPVFRSGFHKALTFTMTYAFSENFVLPLSHDEVVHGKKSLLEKMPGTYHEKFSNLKLLYAYMYAHPGKKLLFMGSEFGQFIEWNEWQALDWHLLNYDSHKNVQTFLKDLNGFYKTEACLYGVDTSYDGYEWIEVDNSKESIISFERIDADGHKLLAIFNFTPVGRNAHPIGVTQEGTYEVVLNSNSERYGGSSPSQKKNYQTENEPAFNRPYSIRIELPGLSAVYIKLKEEATHERR